MTGTTVLGHVRKRKRSYFGHICRAHGCQITKTVVEGFVSGRTSKMRKAYMDNIKQWINITLCWLLVFYRRSWLHDIIALPHT